ncbi:putative glucan endo-1,3-beta-glucosidase A6 [Wolffia australiana]
MAAAAVFLLLVLLGGATAATTPRLGVNYGQLGSDLPSPAAAVQLIRSIGAGAVKLYDANPAILSALAGTNLRVTVMLPNQLIPLAAANQSFADSWVRANLAPFRRSVRLRFLLVGNELLSDASLANSTWPALVPAMARLRRSLAALSLSSVKLGTTAAMDVLAASFPPSAGAFRDDVARPVVAPLLRFLRRTRSFFFLDAYPYFPWAASAGRIALNYALMEGGARAYTDPGSGLVYTNLLDQQLDAVAAAMARLGFADVPLALAETGWPNGGDYDQAGASPRNAAVYNRNLVRRMTASPPAGTPARPGAAIPTFVFSLFNENQKPGPGTERRWGILYPNGTEVYGIDLAGKAELPPLPPPADDGPYRGKIWCVAAPAAESRAAELAAAVEYACGQLKPVACGPIRPGGSCYKPGAPSFQAGYAFNLYWQQFRRSGGTCFFNTLATQTIEDPSTGSCEFPSVLL